MNEEDKKLNQELSDLLDTFQDMDRKSENEWLMSLSEEELTKQLQESLRNKPSEEERKNVEAQLILNMKQQLPQLKELHRRISLLNEDYFYRYYHQSFKVYSAQETVLEMVEAFKRLLPERELNKRFLRIVKSGTGKEFKLEHNREWDRHTWPIMHAFSHAKYFLDVMVKYGDKFDHPQEWLHSGYAAILYLYRIR